ncbi:MAG TPA: DUF1998 domain-containing protein, partial [Campylobacteraceae bacterium]|nr:DUF1998 domain-containing protein [Campylobacteraceae bacterium]
MIWLSSFFCPSLRDSAIISYPRHDQTGKSTIFIYDGYAGGIGLCEKGFAATEELLAQTEKIVTECNCDLGCPTCVHSP